MQRLLLLGVLLAGACSATKWSGGGPAQPSRGEIRVSTDIAPPRPEETLPQATPSQRESAIYYSDLGPETLDISSYPLRQRHNYRTYAAVCSRCHGLARSNNAPIVDRKWWEFYVMGMRLRGRFAGRSLTKDEVAAVLDFLEYDGLERKGKDRKAFEARTEELKRRFELLVDERMRRLQKQPPLAR